MKDPLIYYYEKYGIDQKTIEKIVIGEKYTAVLLNNGNIGVCANLNYKPDNVSLDNIHPLKPEDRIILTAYYNAYFNYNNDYEYQKDIYDTIDFKRYNNVVMIGYFQSLVEKFRNEKISLKIFDYLTDNKDLTDMSLQKQHVSNADCLIISATTLINNTFTGLISDTILAGTFINIKQRNIQHKQNKIYIRFDI